jgi:hypothetical protein
VSNVCKTVMFMLTVAGVVTVLIVEGAVSKSDKAITLVGGNYLQKQAIANSLYVIMTLLYTDRSRWPRGLRRDSAAVRLPGLRFRIAPGAWISVICEC